MYDIDEPRVLVCSTKGCSNIAEDDFDLLCTECANKEITGDDQVVFPAVDDEEHLEALVAAELASGQLDLDDAWNEKRSEYNATISG